MSEAVMTAKQEFAWETIPLLDDKVPTALNIEMQEAIRDLQNRPHLEDKRTVRLTIEFIPTRDEETGEVDSMVQFHVSPCSKPARKSRPHRIALMHNQPRAYFNADTPDRPRTGGLFDKQTIPIQEAVANKARGKHPEVD